MLKSILFGPASLSSNKPPSRITQGKVWGTTYVTPGAIALMAVLVSPNLSVYNRFNQPTNFKAIFLHSPDKEFASDGGNSKIPYESWFQQFKHYLTKNATLPDIKHLFMWWNGCVFSFDTTGKRTESDGKESSGMDEAELGLNASDGSEDFPLMNHQENHDDGFIHSFDNLTLGQSAATEINTNIIVVSTSCMFHFHDG